MLTRDDATHQYFRDGRPVINVTRALALVTDYSHIPGGVLKHAQDEGIAIHRCIELYVKDDLDEATLPEWLLPRLNAFKRFVAETGFRLKASEKFVYNGEHDYAGQLDLDGDIVIGNGRHRKIVAATIDIKRSFYAGRAIGLQTSAYTRALEYEERQRGITPPRRSRFALQLRADGTYRLEPFTDPSDYAGFLACLHVWRLREQLRLPLPSPETAS